MKMRHFFLFATSLFLFLLPGCRRTDVREMTVSLPALQEADKAKVAEALARYNIESDHAGTIATIVEYSGQPEEYIENITYGKGDYVAAMKFEMDPYTDDVKAFYGDMIDNGDIDDTNKELIVEHMDSTIYKAALDALIERGENKDFYEKLAADYEKHNTLGS